MRMSPEKVGSLVLRRLTGVHLLDEVDDGVSAVPGEERLRTVAFGLWS